MRLPAIAAAVVALILAGCGGSRGGTTETAAGTATAGRTTSSNGEVTSRVPPGAVGPVDTTEQAAEGPAAGEASPEAAASGPRSTGDLPEAAGAAVTAAVRNYVAALDRHQAARICALIVKGGVDLSDLPKRRGGCRSSLHASIGVRPAAGGPAWQRTEVVEVKPEALGNDRARVTTTVTHHFADRRYVSVEDDVIYLERIDGRWLLAKPSATLYRAVGYAQPPLRAFAPPSGW